MNKSGAAIEVWVTGKLHAAGAVLFPACSDPACRRWRGKAPWRASGYRLHGNWYCTADCFETAMVQYFRNTARSATEPPSAVHRIPLGLILLAKGTVTRPQLRQALVAQQTAGTGRIGEWLLALGLTTEQEVTAALAQQWRCPIYPVDAPAQPRWADMIPVPILESFHIMPVYYVHSTRVLHIAFCEGIDHGILYRIEQMLDCRSEPCLLPCRLMQQLLDNVRQRSRSNEIVFQKVCDPPELAHIIRGYAVKLNASDVRIIDCGIQIWARFQCDGYTVNLVFSRRELPGRHYCEMSLAS